MQFKFLENRVSLNLPFYLILRDDKHPLEGYGVGEVQIPIKYFLLSTKVLMKICWNT